MLSAFKLNGQKFRKKFFQNVEEGICNSKYSVLSLKRSCPLNFNISSIIDFLLLGTLDQLGTITCGIKRISTQYVIIILFRC